MLSKYEFGELLQFRNQLKRIYAVHTEKWVKEKLEKVEREIEKELNRNIFKVN